MSAIETRGAVHFLLTCDCYHLPFFITDSLWITGRGTAGTRACTDDCNAGDRHANIYQYKLNPLTPTVAIWVQLYSILCQTELSRHL